jgi:chromate reductase, NAD(P)H dehydrogenase (quinone)
MPRKILLLSATSKNNFNITKQVESVILQNYNNEFVAELMNIEDLDLPLYTPSNEKKGIPAAAQMMCHKFMSVDAIFLAAPEYNGSIPPVVSNLFSWMSRSGDKNWRAAFIEKYFLIATHSGGPGAKYLIAIRTMLDHLGAIVLPRTMSAMGENNLLKPESITACLDLLKRHVK